MAITPEFLASVGAPQAVVAAVAAARPETSGATKPGILERLGASPAAPASEPTASTQANVAPGSVLHVAIGRTARSGRIAERHGLSFDQLAQLLQTWPLHVGKLTLAEYSALKAGAPEQKAQAAADKDCQWFSLGRFSKAQRTAVNVVSVSGWVGDADRGNLSPEQIAERLGNCFHIVYTSYSHSPACPKYRIVVPYSRPATPAEHARAFDALAALFGDAIDCSTRDPCRLWYFPSAAADMVQHRQLIVHQGDGALDLDALLAGLDAADESAASLPQRGGEAGAHQNDALAYAPERRELSTDDVRRMLACIAIPDVAGQRRGMWLKALQAVHDWSGGSDDGFALIDAWSAGQPSYAGSNDVRAIWDSCRGHGITIASVVSMAIEGGFSFEPATAEDAVDEATPAADAGAAPSGGTIRDLRARIEAHVGTGDTKQVAALRELEADLVYVSDQQAYRSLSDGLFLNSYSIRQKYKAAMPRAANGQRLDPCKLLENSASKRIVSALDYHPGEGQTFARVDGRLRLNDYAAPAGPWRLPADSHVRHTVARLLAQALLDQTDAARLADKYAFLLQHMGRRIPHATVLVGEMQGTGKTFITLDLARGLFGDRNVVKIGQQELDSDFTDYLAHAQVLCVEEIAMQHSRGDSRRLYNALKDPLTSPTLRIHPKGLKAYDVANHMSVFATSNYPDAVALVPKDRRWDIMAARPARLPADLARDMRQILDSPDGCAMLRDVFLSRDISNFEVFADPPETEAKKAMEAANVDDLGQELQLMAENRAPPFDRDFGTLEQVRAGLGIRVRRFGESPPGRLGAALRRVLGAEKRKRRVGVGAAQWVWFWRHQPAWLLMSEAKLLDHMQTGAPPLELVCDTAPAAPVSAEG